MPKDEPHSATEIADVWISYHLWSATRPIRHERLSLQQLREQDAESARQGFWAFEASDHLYVLLSPAAGFGVVTAQSVGATPVPLLPGYTHRSSEFGIDSAGGEFWKPNGPSISYDIGSLVGNGAEAYARRFPKLPTIRLTTPAHRFVVVLDEEHDAMVVSTCYRANWQGLSFAAVSGTPQ